MNLRACVDRHPLIVGWIVLAAVFVAVVLVVSLGRELDVWQYVGLSVVAVVLAGLSVSLAFGADSESETEN